MTSLTQALAPILSRPVDAAGRARAALAVVDWLGCAFAGAVEPAGRLLRADAAAEGAGPATVIGGAARSEAAAAFANGGLGNILEMDDVHRTAILHPGPVTIPAALAVAEAAGASGAAFLDAVVAGYEAVIRVGRSLGPGHYALWHNTASVGPFGSAAAVARLLGLGEEATVAALGNAGTQVSGPWQCRHEPVMTKQLHTARAAHAGLKAARLAALGFTGPAFILEGPQGLYRATAPDAAGDRVTAEPDGPFLIHETSVKPWPACRHAHAAIDSALLARARLLALAEGTVDPGGIYLVRSGAPAEAAIGDAMRPDALGQNPTEGAAEPAVLSAAPGGAPVEAWSDQPGPQGRTPIEGAVDPAVPPSSSDGVPAAAASGRAPPPSARVQDASESAADPAVVSSAAADAPVAAAGGRATPPAAQAHKLPQDAADPAVLSPVPGGAFGDRALQSAARGKRSSEGAADPAVLSSTRGGAPDAATGPRTDRPAAPGQRPTEGAADAAVLSSAAAASPVEAASGWAARPGVQGLDASKGAADPAVLSSPRGGAPDEATGPRADRPAAPGQRPTVGAADAAVLSSAAAASPAEAASGRAMRPGSQGQTSFGGAAGPAILSSPRGGAVGEATRDTHLMAQQRGPAAASGSAAAPSAQGGVPADAAGERTLRSEVRAREPVDERAEPTLVPAVTSANVWAVAQRALRSQARTQDHGEAVTDPAPVAAATDDVPVEAAPDPRHDSRESGTGARPATPGGVLMPQARAGSSGEAEGDAPERRARWMTAHIAAVTVRTYGDAVRFCDRADPVTALEAKFSLQHAVAATLVGGPPPLGVFEPAAIGREVLAALRRRVSVVRDAAYDSAYPARYGTGLDVVLTDGTRFSVDVPDALGDPENPLPPDGVVAKGRTLLAHAGVPDAEAEALIDAALGLPDAPDLRRLSAALAAAGRALAT